MATAGQPQLRVPVRHGSGAKGHILVLANALSSAQAQNQTLAFRLKGGQPSCCYLANRKQQRFPADRGLSCGNISWGPCLRAFLGGPALWELTGGAPVRLAEEGVEGILKYKQGLSLRYYWAGSQSHLISTHLTLKPLPGLASRSSLYVSGDPGLRVQTSVSVSSP